VSTIPGDPNGPGGGGSGGIIWFNSPDFIDGNIFYNISGGYAGKYSGQLYGSGDGASSIPKKSLKIVIRGFLLIKSRMANLSARMRPLLP